MAVCKAIDAEDTWFIANNLNKFFAIREYKKRFQIEEMFKDFKSGGFNLESTWSMDIHYIRMLYLCISIAYSWIITLGVSCKKDKKNKIISVTKNLKGQQVRNLAVCLDLELNGLKDVIIHHRNYYHLKFVLHFMKVNV